MRLLPGLLLSCTLAQAPVAFAQHSDAEVKAAFIFNVAKFVEWSPETLPTGAPIRFCVLGGESSQLTHALVSLNGKVLRGRNLEVRNGPRFDPLKPCHITVLMPDAGEQKRLLQEERNTLTVADSENFVENGGMVGLSVVNNRVAFDANLASAKRGGIELPAQLLKLARKVKGS